MIVLLTRNTLQEFDVTSKNRLENVKFKEIGNGSYINNNQFTVDCLAKNLGITNKEIQICLTFII